MIKKPRLKDGTANTIPVNIAQQMTQAYRDNQKKLGETDFTEAAWYPATQILQLAKKLTACKADGLRIYFARYTEEIINQINKLPYGDVVSENYKDMDTLLLVITKIVNGVPRTDYFTDKQLTKHYGGVGADPYDPENRADLCPDQCNTKSPLMQ